MKHSFYCECFFTAQIQAVSFYMRLFSYRKIFERKQKNEKETQKVTCMSACSAADFQRRADERSCR